MSRNGGFRTTVAAIVLTGLSLRAPVWADDFSTALTGGFRKAEIVHSHMNRTRAHSIARALQAVPMDAGSESFEGTLSLEPKKNVTLTSAQDTVMTLKDGPIFLKYGTPHVTSFLTGNRTIAIFQDGQTAVLPASQSKFFGFDGFATSDSALQGISLLGGRASRPVKQFTRTASRACTYAGYCSACSYDRLGRPSCGVGYYTSCGGSQDVDEAVTVTEYLTKIEIRDRDRGNLLGVITGPPNRSESATVIREITSCR